MKTGWESCVPASYRPGGRSGQGRESAQICTVTGQRLIDLQYILEIALVSLQTAAAVLGSRQDSQRRLTERLGAAKGHQRHALGSEDRLRSDNGRAEVQRFTHRNGIAVVER